MAYSDSMVMSGGDNEMIKQRKTKCWEILCDRCGMKIDEMGDVFIHYDTKKEAKEFEEEYKEYWNGKKQVLCNECKQKENE